jgi:CRP/FNR family transcriptional regulator, dissimilatory nitrate respiration regulator
MSKLTTSEKIATLQGVPLFSALSKSELQELLRICLTRDYPAGSYVIQQEEIAESFYVILRGKVKIYNISSQGDEQILHMYGPSQVFAEAAMLAGIKIPARVATLTDTTLLVVRRKALKELLAKNPELALTMMAGMAAKLREFNQLISQLSLQDVPARVASEILQQANRIGKDTFKLAQSKQQLAAQIGTVPETLSRALKKLKDAGAIDVQGPTITILDKSALEDLIE